MTQTESNPNKVAQPPWLLRVLVVAVGLGLWFATQWLIGARLSGPSDETRIAGQMISRGDGLFRVTRPINEYLHERSEIANALLIVSSLLIDLLGLWLIAASIFGKTMRPFVGLLIVFALRQVTQALCALPPPEGMIWRSPGVPSLLVTYQVANDFFFSGHTAIAVFGATQLFRLRRPVWAIVGVAIALFEAGTVICLRAHYSMDVLAGAVAALWAAHVADRLAPVLDHWLLQLAARGKSKEIL